MSNSYGSGSTLGIVVPSLPAGYANEQAYADWVGAQNTENANANFIQVGWVWENGYSDEVFIQQWINGNLVQDNRYPNFPLGPSGSISVRLQTSGNNLYYPFILWNNAWVDVCGCAFQMGFSATPYQEVIGEGVTVNGAPIPTIPTDTDSGNVELPVGGNAWVNWPWNYSQYAPPYCIYSSTPWTSFQTWDEPNLHC